MGYTISSEIGIGYMINSGDSIGKEWYSNGSRFRAGNSMQWEWFWE